MISYQHQGTGDSLFTPIGVNHESKQPISESLHESSCESKSLKALAYKASERITKRITHESPSEKGESKRESNGLKKALSESSRFTGDSTISAIDEALAERQAIHEIEGGIDPVTAEDLSRLDHQFHNHIFGPGKQDNCCAPRHGSYCEEGRKLKEQYYKACRLAEKKRRQSND